MASLVSGVKRVVVDFSGDIWSSLSSRYATTCFVNVVMSAASAVIFVPAAYIDMSSAYCIIFRLGGGEGILVR